MPPSRWVYVVVVFKFRHTYSLSHSCMHNVYVQVLTSGEETAVTLPELQMSHKHRP